MGCGISKIDPKEASDRPKRSNKRSNNNTINVEEAADDFANDHHGARKSVSSLPITAVNNKRFEETDDVERDRYYNEKGHSKKSSFYDRGDAIAYPASPSFREYCVDSGADNDRNGGKDEVGLQGERPLNSEKAHGSRSPESNMKSTRRGFRSAMYKPAGWIGKSKK